MRIVSDTKPGQMKLVTATRQPARAVIAQDLEVQAEVIRASVITALWLGRWVFNYVTDIMATKVADKIEERNRGS